MQVHLRSVELSQSLKSSLAYLQDHPFIPLALMGAVLVMVSLLVIRRMRSQQSDSDDAFTHKDFNRIAGEDVVSTQLDLAKAYIEMNQIQLAKGVLKQVLKHAKGEPKQTARQLMKTL
ncbi:MAG: FimV/HubP family polar landmark protein [Gammaproteobacteria bacterium]|nr:FimV/HubP family polar landmark protein [Gammaproteobacteria bacterium]